MGVGKGEGVMVKHTTAAVWQDHGVANGRVAVGEADSPTGERCSLLVVSGVFGFQLAAGHQPDPSRTAALFAKVVIAHLVVTPSLPTHF